MGRKSKTRHAEIKWGRKRGRERKGWGFLASHFCNLIKVMTQAQGMIHTQGCTQIQCNCFKPLPSILQTAHGCLPASLSALLSSSLWASSLASLSIYLPIFHSFHIPPCISTSIYLSSASTNLRLVNRFCVCVCVPLQRLTLLLKFLWFFA